MKLEKIKGIYEDVRNEGLCSVIRDYMIVDRLDNIETVGESFVSLMKDTPAIIKYAALPYLAIACSLVDLILNKDDVEF